MSAAVYPTPPGLTFGVNFTPRFATSVQSSTSGRETRIALMPYPMYDVDLTYEFLRSSAAYPELQQLVAFFNQAGGSWDSWNWLNPDDNQATAQQIGTGNGAQTQFQLLRSFGGYSEPVFAPFNVTSILVNGSAVGNVYLGNGVYQLSSAPAAGAVVAWTGQYYYRARFKDDTAGFSKFMQNLWENKKVSFIANLQGRLGLN